MRCASPAFALYLPHVSDGALLRPLSGEGRAPRFEGIAMSAGLTILYVSDTHGRVLPVDYATGQAAPGGLLGFAACAREARRAAEDADVLVIDGGDSLQGTPLIQRYLADPECWETHPVAGAFNEAGVDFFTMGNHDFNFGYEPLAAYLRAMEGTCVCANVEDERGELQFVSHAVRTMPNGLRVGVTGAVTDWVNVWESSHGGPEGVRVSDPLPALAREAQVLRDAGCDVLVCVYHGGFEDDLASGATLETSGENVGCRMARELGFDLVLTAHQHREVEGVHIGDAWCVQPGCNARKYLVVEGSCEGGDWSFASHFEDIPAVEVDASTHGELLTLEGEVQRALDEPIGELARDVPAIGMLESALQGNPLADLINAAQLEAAHRGVGDVPMLSCTALANVPVGMPAHVTMRDVVRLYQFQNSLSVLEVSGDDLRQVLERCAAYFALDEAGEFAIAREFLDPKVQHFNHDYYAGLDVGIDVSRPVGQRVVSLRLTDGTPVDPEGCYLMAMNDYRATGTGGYDCLRNARTVWTGSDSVPDIIASYIEGHSPVTLDPLGRVEVMR